MKWFSIIGIVLIVGTLGYCRDVIFPYSWHQKMTIEVEVDGQVYSGSSVVRVNWRKNDPMGDTHGPTWLSAIRGEAVFVEIPERGVLFALLNFAGNTSYIADLPTRIMTERKKGWARGKKEFRAVEAAEGKTSIVPESHYPLLVTFSDLTDPKTVQKVDPENLGATFGSGVSLKRITLEITDEPVTEGKIRLVLKCWMPLAVACSMVVGYQQ